MNTNISSEYDGYLTTICRAMGVVATLVAMKANREPVVDRYQYDLEKDEPVRKAPIDLLFEMASFLKLAAMTKHFLLD